MGIIALNEVKTPSDALEFADALVSAGRRKTGESSFAAAEAALASACAYYLADCAPPGEQTLENIDRMLRMSKSKVDDEDYVSPLDSFFEMLETGKVYDGDGKFTQTGNPQPDHFALQQYRKFKDGIDAEAEKAVVLSARAHLASLVDHEKGRRRGPQEGPLICTVTVKVSERMKEDFESAAEKAGASVPDALREAISSYIATHA